MRDGRTQPLLLAGLILLVAGGLIGPLVGPRSYLPRLLAVSGTLALLWGVVRSAPTWRRFFRRMRETAEPGPVTVWALLGLLLLVLSLAFGLQGLRLDLTRRGLHSLSPVSREALARPGAEVELIGVYRESMHGSGFLRELLRVYRTQGRGIRTRLLDPEREPQEARRLEIAFTNGLLVRADSARQIVEELTEESITTAILRVREPRRPIVLLLEGHGETGPGRAGFAELRRACESAGASLRRIDLGGTEAVPEDASAVLVAGPATPLLPGEIAALRAFLAAGGRVGVFADPGTETGLEPLLRGQGAEIDGRRIRDDGPLTRSVGLGPETIAVESLGEHAITRGLTAAIVLRGATRVRVSSAALSQRRGTLIFRSAASARLLPETAIPGRTIDDEGPLSASHPLGVALAWPVRADSAGAGVAAARGEVPQRAEARMLVIGDSDLLRDDTIGLYGNREFVTRAVGWLTAREFLLSFPPVDRGGTPLRAGVAEFRLIFYLVELLLPLAMFGLAFWTWWRRR